MTAAFTVGAAAVGAAALAAGFTGFGFNLVAAPLLLSVFEPKDVVPITLLLGLLTSSLVAATAGKRREIDVPLLGLLMAGSLPGLLLGTFAFAALDPDALRNLIGGTAVVCAALVLFARPISPRPARTGESILVGVLSGSLAGSTGTGGPPVVAYLTMTTHEAARLRGTILGHVSLASLLALLGLALHGDVTSAQIAESVKLVPAVVGGLVAGSYLFRRSPAAVYLWTTRVSLISAAVIGAVAAIR